MQVNSLNIPNPFFSDFRAFANSLRGHSVKLLLEGGLVGLLGLFEHFGIEVNSKNFAVWCVPLIIIHAFWLAFTDQRRMTEAQGTIVKSAVDEVAANYIRLYTKEGQPLDGFMRLALLVEAGIMKLKNVPNSIARVHQIAVSANTPGPLCDGWGNENLYFRESCIFPFLEWALPRGYMLKRNINEIWDQHAAAELSAAMNPQMDRVPDFPTLSAIKPDSGPHGPVIILC